MLPVLLVVCRLYLSLMVGWSLKRFMSLQLMEAYHHHYHLGQLDKGFSFHHIPEGRGAELYLWYLICHLCFSFLNDPLNCKIQAKYKRRICILLGNNLAIAGWIVIMKCLLWQRLNEPRLGLRAFPQFTSACWNLQNPSTLDAGSFHHQQRQLTTTDFVGMCHFLNKQDEVRSIDHRCVRCMSCIICNSGQEASQVSTEDTCGLLFCHPLQRYSDSVGVPILKSVK